MSFHTPSLGRLKVPDGFASLLEGLAREILRQQPENIYDFAADYFECLSKANDAKEATRADEIDIDLSDPDVGAAAVKIQKSFRRFRESKKISDDVPDKIPDTTEETNVIVPAVDETSKGEEEEQQGKVEEKEEEEIDIDLDDPDVAKAAVKIQANFRGFKARKSLKVEEDVKPAEKDEGEEKVLSGGDNDIHDKQNEEAKESAPDDGLDEKEIACASDSDDGAKDNEVVGVHATAVGEEVNDIWIASWGV